MDLFETLHALCAPLGPSGREDQVRALIGQLAGPHAHRLETDRMGNLRAWINPERRPLLMLDAHMDEVCFVVQRIEQGGWLRIAATAGFEPRVLPGARVIIQPRPGREVVGVVGLLPPHLETPADREKALPIERLFVDIGAASEQEAREAGVEVGSPAVADAGGGRLGAKGFYQRNLDDRAGCAALLELLRRLALDPPDLGVVCNFAVAEEVGLRGAATAAFDLDPDLALAVDVTMADTPGADPAKQVSRLGGGPVVTVLDGRIVVPWAMVDSLEEAAKAIGAPIQRKTPPYGGTDAGAIHLARGGVPCGVLSIPGRYIHSPVSLINLDDLAATVDVLERWARSAGQLAELLAGRR